MTQEPEGGAAPRSSSGRGSVDRRRFLQMATLGGAGLILDACGGDKPALTAADRHRPHAKAKKHKQSTTDTTSTTTRLSSGVVIPTAPWLIAENAKAGTLNWVIGQLPPEHAMEGFASQVSAVAGDNVELFINTTAKAVQVEAYRMGYYGGLGGRLIHQTDMVAAGAQPHYTVMPGVGTVSCPWSPTLTLNIDATWPPGCYLLKLVGSGGEQQYIPLTIRDDASTAAFVLQNSVTTWQAYNLWGNYSLYYGPNSSGRAVFSDRARAVSFDRPYPQTWAAGSADFLGNEFPLLYHLESLGADLTYSTDIDLHAQPALLLKHRCLFSLGHDEYWSREMRDAATFANSGGVNLAFLGANAVYRQIRLQSTSVGPNRLQVCYKSAAEDPMAKINPALTTVNWPDPPVNDPESTLVGLTYQSVGANANMVITDAGSWFFDGCNTTDGQQLPTMIVGEYDRYVPNLPGPRNIDILAHSPIPGQNNWADVSYYTNPGKGGGVLASGSAYFIFRMSNATYIPDIVVPKAIPGETQLLLRAMENLYGVFGAGPAGNTHPSTGNWSSVYTGAAAGAGSAGGTNAA